MDSAFILLSSDNHLKCTSVQLWNTAAESQHFSPVLLSCDADGPCWRLPRGRSISAPEIYMTPVVGLNIALAPHHLLFFTSLCISIPSGFVQSSFSSINAHNLYRFAKFFFRNICFVVEFFKQVDRFILFKWFTEYLYKMREDWDQSYHCFFAM